jgi:tripartite-type tricarboxylate transporter receptor subunit TctC
MRPVIALLAAALATSAALAQDYPTKQIRIVSGFAPGATSDLIGRAIGDRLRVAWNATVVNDNRPGAGGALAAEMVAKSPPDGHAMLIGAAAIATLPALRKDLPFELFKDLAPVTILGTVPFMLIVQPALPVNSVQELVAYAKQNPGKLNFGSGGNGTIPHLGGELFKTRAGIQMTHVPYKGGAQSVAAMLGGQVQLTIDGGPHVVTQVQAKAVRLLAVATLQRLPEYPDVPTIAESGYPGFEANAWQSLWVTGGTPPEVVRRINAEVARIVRTPEMTERFRAMGVVPVANAPEEAEKFIRAETAKWTEVIRVSGAKSD